MKKKVYYISDRHFMLDLKNYLKEGRKIAVGYDGELNMYYITEL